LAFLGAAFIRTNAESISGWGERGKGTEPSTWAMLLIGFAGIGFETP